MDEKYRRQILNMLNGMGGETPSAEDGIKKAAAEMAKMTKILLDAFEYEGLAHNDAMPMVMSILNSIIIGQSNEM